MYILEFMTENSDIIFPIASIIVSIFVFWRTSKKAKKALDASTEANNAAAESNTIAKDANTIAQDANTIAMNARDIAQEKLDLTKESIRRTEERDYNEGRPRMKVKGVYFNTEYIDIYVGSNVMDWRDFAYPINGKHYKSGEKLCDDYTKEITGNVRMFKNTLWEHKDKQYMLINLITSAKKTDLESSILAFGVLKLEITLGNPNAVKEFKIEKAYSIKSKMRYFGERLRINFKYQDPPSLIQLYVAYAYKSDDNTSLFMNNICKYWKEAKDTGELISYNLLKHNPGINATEFISFTETAYVIKCTTNKYEYLYTIVLKEKNGQLYLEEYDNTAYFDKRVSKREHIVMYAEDYDFKKERKP